VGRADALVKLALARVARHDGALVLVLRDRVVGRLLEVKTQARLLHALAVAREAVLRQDRTHVPVPVGTVRNGGTARVGHLIAFVVGGSEEDASAHRNDAGADRQTRRADLTHSQPFIPMDYSFGTTRLPYGVPFLMEKPCGFPPHP